MPNSDDVHDLKIQNEDRAARMVVIREVKHGGIPQLIHLLQDLAEDLEDPDPLPTHQRLAEFAIAFTVHLLPEQAGPIDASPLTLRLLASLLQQHYPSPEPKCPSSSSSR